MRHASLCLIALGACAVVDPPRTTAESSMHTATSTHGDVLAFVSALPTLPYGDRIRSVPLAVSGEGRELPLVIAADPACSSPETVHASGKLRVLVNANIHGGEVEGKEAALALLREIALGDHDDVLEGAVLLFVPDFNPDGNDRIDAGNRQSQNGPDAVGERANAGGLDLNRDFLKAESPEVRGLLRAFADYDPHVLLDLHTTNGSAHGYHLTYAPSLSANVDPDLDRFGRHLLREVRGQVAARHGVRVFDYGNFSRGGARTWSTYDHRPRFGTNYYGLRNRLAFLSEAYSYLDFATRIAATRAFVLEVLRASVEQAATIHALCAAADARVVAGETRGFGWDTELAPGTVENVLVGQVRREGARRIAEPEYESESMPVRRAFAAGERTPLPGAWAVLRPSDEVLDNLALHGVAVERTLSEVTCEGEVLASPDVERATRAFQGHHLVSIDGAHEVRSIRLPVGTAIVRARQPLGRLAAQLLEGLSEDSLATWNFFDDWLAGSGGELGYPVVRLLDPLPELPVAGSRP